MKKAAGDSEDLEDFGSSGSQLVTSDGTYATQSAFITNTPRNGQSKRPPFRQYLIDGDFYIGAALGTTFTKLGIKYAEIWNGQDLIKSNQFCVNLMLILTYILKLGKSGNLCLIIIDSKLNTCKYNVFLYSVRIIIYLFCLGICSKSIGIDDEDKILESIKILNDRDTAIEEIYTRECSKSLNEMLAAKEDEESTNKKVSCLVKFTI